MNDIDFLFPRVSLSYCCHPHAISVADFVHFFTSTMQSRMCLCLSQVFRHCVTHCHPIFFFYKNHRYCQSTHSKLCWIWSKVT